MAPNLLNSSNLEQLTMKGLKSSRSMFFNLFIGMEPFGVFRLLVEPKGLFYSKQTETTFFCT